MPFTREQLRVLSAELGALQRWRIQAPKIKKPARVAAAEKVVNTWNRELRHADEKKRKEYEKCYAKAKRALYFGTLKEFDAALAALRRFK